MHTYVLEEMADALSTKLHIQSSDALAVLSHFWEDKIADVWDVENVYEAAYHSEYYDPVKAFLRSRGWTEQ